VSIDPTRPGAVVRAAVLLGIVAGLLAAVFMTVVGEPWVDDAIALEEAALAEDGADHGRPGTSTSPRSSPGPTSGASGSSPPTGSRVAPSGCSSPSPSSDSAGARPRRSGGR
jgi:hypothetical protein